MRSIGFVILLVVVAAGGYLVWDAWSGLGPPIPREAKILVNPNEEEAKVVLPHRVEDSTYFEESLGYLAEGAVGPKVIRSLPANNLTGDALNRLEPGRHLGTLDARARNWMGAVLVPDMKIVSKAHTDLVSLDRVEAHPIEDGRLRVWARIRNQTGETLRLERDCTFRFVGQLGMAKPRFETMEIPAAAVRDVMFESEKKGVAAYTLLIRQYQEDSW